MWPVRAKRQRRAAVYPWSNGGNGFAGDCHWQGEAADGSEMSISRVLGRYRLQGRTEETSMHPTASYYLGHQAQRDTVARAARRARPDRQDPNEN